MASLTQLEAYTRELSAAVKSLVLHGRNGDSLADWTGRAGADAPPPDEAQRARRAVLANVAKLQTLLAEPADFLQQLAKQVRTHSPSPSPCPPPSKCFPPHI
jgi:hypothetical protein